MSAVETCAKPATDEFIEAAEKALDAGGVIATAAKYLRLERYPAHFQGFVQLEQEALSVSSYCVVLIDGLLQTQEYAQRLFDHAFPRWRRTKSIAWSRLGWSAGLCSTGSQLR